MILKANVVAQLLEEGAKDETTDPFVIMPMPDLKVPSQIGSASVDLRLGTWFVTLRQGHISHLKIGGTDSQLQLTKTHYVPFGGEYFLHPGSFVLCASLEWIRVPKNIAAYVIGKSSWGRRGLVIATAAGVHPGFTGCLTLELSNVGEIPISITPGTKICQLFFHHVDTTGSETIATSHFVGLRKPILGNIELDSFAKQLSNSQHL